MKFIILTALISLSLPCLASTEWNQVSKEVRSQLKMSLENKLGTISLNNTTWKLIERFCAASLSPADIANPNRVYDLTGYHQTWHFDDGGKQVFEIHNAAKDGGPCSTKITGQFGYSDIPGDGPITAVMATTTTKRERTLCPSTYAGPSLGLIHLLNWVTPNLEYRDATLAGSINTTVCPNVTDYLITNWKKYDTL